MKYGDTFIDDDPIWSQESYSKTVLSMGRAMGQSVFTEPWGPSERQC